MNRRQFLSLGCTGTLIAVTGCTTPSQSTLDNTPVRTPESLSVTDYNFTKLDASKTPDDATIERVDGNTVTITGTITVKDGCTTIALGAPPEVSEENERTIKAMIGTRDTGGDMCTQALRDIGYQLEFTFEGARPSSIQLAQAGTDSKVTELQVPME